MVDAAWADNGPGWKVVQLGDVDKLRSLEFSGGGDKVGFVALTGGADPWCEVRAFEITGDGRDIWVGGQVTARVRGTIDLWAR